MPRLGPLLMGSAITSVLRCPGLVCEVSLFEVLSVDPPLNDQVPLLGELRIEFADDLAGMRFWRS